MSPAVRRLAAADCRATVDGVEVAAREGETVAATLLAATDWRSLYCGMGACFVCTVTIDGVPGRRACLETVRPGMVIETGVGDDA
jgi:hypothetical protein